MSGKRHFLAKLMKHATTLLLLIQYSSENFSINCSKLSLMFFYLF